MTALQPVQSEPTAGLVRSVAAARRAHLAGDLATAAVRYDEALRLVPNDADLLHLRGALAWQQGDLGTAARLIDAVLSANPTHAAAHNTRGVIARAQGDLAAARATFGRAFALRPGTLLYASNLAIAAIDDGAADAGIDLLRGLAGANPKAADAHRALGDALIHASRPQEAVAPLERAVTLAPQAVEHRFVLGHAHHLTGAITDAARHYEAVLAADPNHARAWQNLGRAHADLGDADGGFACLERALALAPDNAENHANLAVALRRRGDLTAALERYDEAIARDPSNPRTRYHHALTLLLAGDFALGWVEHEWRARMPGFPIRRDLLARPAWTGDALAGRTLLLHSEQGLGDTIQFARYAATIGHAGLAQDGRIVLMVQPALAAVLRPFAGAAEVVPADAPVPGHDVQAPLLSLPLLLGTVPDRIPAAVPYLQACSNRRRQWASSLCAKGLRVGLVWAGNPGHGNDRERSLAPAVARGLATALLQARSDLYLFGLQLGPRARELDDLPPRYRSLAPAIADFADTAAILAELDALVCVDTSIAHLAGALARPTYMLLPFAPDWRWRTHGTTTPWYPALRLCRAAAEGDPTVAISAACEGIAHLS